MFSTFPDGGPGIGLLILRVALGLTILFGGVDYLAEAGGSAVLNWILGFLIFASVAFLLIGFLTPPVALIALAGAALLLASGEASLPTDIYAVILATATALLGPGAFSLDAQLFGRREIVIPKMERDR